MQYRNFIVMSLEYSEGSQPNSVCNPGLVTWVNFCWVTNVPLLSQNSCPIIVYSVAKYRPHLGQFWANVIVAIPTQ